MSRSGEAIWAAYADVDPARRCSNCGAAPGVWCTAVDGRVRRIPCVARPRVAVDAVADAELEALDYSEPRRPRGVAGG